VHITKKYLLFIIPNIKIPAFWLFGLGDSPAKFEIKPKVPNCDDRDRNQVSKILINSKIIIKKIENNQV